jgi:hypothetical protein
MTQSIIDDSEMGIPAFSPVCIYCKNLLDNGLGRRCKAFKNIPMPIWQGKNNHKKAYRGDGGITFDKILE